MPRYARSEACVNHVCEGDTRPRKDEDEEQASSAHLVIDTQKGKAGDYNAALEEMPGLSLSVVRPIIALALNTYRYAYQDRKSNDQETYSTFKAFGLKSESLTAALKKRGSINYLHLTRTTVPDAPDSDGIAEPQQERIKYKILGDPTLPEWRAKLRTFVNKVRAEDWDDVTLDINLEDERHRTVKLDRESEASEIMFVRSEQVSVRTELNPCSVVVIKELALAAKSLMEKS